MRYFVELDGSEPGVGYDVAVPDLPGCTSAGDDLDEALRNAKEAIALHLEAMIADGEPVPARTSKPAAPSVPGALIGFVEVDLHTPSPSNRATRLSVTIPEHALALIDFAAKRAGTSRSEFLTRSALTCIEQDAHRNA